MLLRAVSVFVWAWLAASAVFWGLRLFAVAPGLPPGTQPATTVAGAQADLSRLLGADPVAAEPLAAAADARFHLLGVVSPRAGAPAAAAAEGLALIEVDGKPARAFHIGAAVTDSAQLQSVSPRGATLGPRNGQGASVSLHLPPLTSATTGAPPAAATGYPSAAPILPYRPALSPPFPQPAAAPGGPIRPIGPSGAVAR